MKLGIVDKVVPLDELRETAIKIAQDFAQTHSLTLSELKKLLNYSRKDLKDYLDLENEVLISIVESSDFRQKLEG